MISRFLDGELYVVYSQSGCSGVLGRVTDSAIMTCMIRSIDGVGGSNWKLRIVRYEVMLDDLVTAGRSLKWKGHQRPEVRLLFHLSCVCGVVDCVVDCVVDWWHMRMK